MKKCWLCLRITPKIIARAAHKIFEKDRKLSHELLEKAMEYIERAYNKNPVFFCAKTKARIISGLFYLLCFKLGERKTQEQIANAVGCSMVTLRNGYQDWERLFPEEFDANVLLEEWETASWKRLDERYGR